MEASRSAQQRYHHISAQLKAFNAQGEVTHREKLATRCNFEHVVRGLIDELGGLEDNGSFNAAWMTFCQENLLAEKRIAKEDRLDAYERGRRRIENTGRTVTHCDVSRPTRLRRDLTQLALIMASS